ncbi:hypothetical protein ACIGHN_12055 [Acidovorax sp. NPDC077693]|uniref:hypothetical protein n=1 Tax=unclassified Acidovorax TaxID=2684926 RepID=UPI0037C85CE0
MPKNRRTSFTVIAWLLIASSAVALAGFATSHGNSLAEDVMRQNPLPLLLQYGIGYFGLAVQVVCAIAILRGRPWGRLVYTGWGTMGLLIGFATSPVKTALIPGAVLFAVIVFFLFRPAGNAFLKAS